MARISSERKITMIFIANFKMMIATPAVIDLFHKNLHHYTALAQRHTIILCPSATALREVAQIFTGSRVTVGGQTCAPAHSGAFTGDISPADLAACGATYCLVGHSERRALYSETDEQIGLKTKLLSEVGITPIICVGETLAEYETGNTLQVLSQQLATILSATPTTHPLLIAYEPRWAIGTGLTPTLTQLNTTFAALKQYIEKTSPNLPFKLLYGGSVSSKTIPTLASVAPLDGFLIGGASLDFQEFQKIVNYFD